MSMGEYVEYRRSRGPVCEVRGGFWMFINQMLIPVDLPAKGQNPVIDRGLLAQALKQANAKLASWTYDFDGPESPWWWVICDDREYDISKCKKPSQRQIRQGLRNCEVRRVEPDWLAEHGYDCYRADAVEYLGSRVQSKEVFYNIHSRLKGYNWFHAWAALADGRVIAFITCYMLDGKVNIATGRSHPAYLKLRPNNALMFTATRHYLLEEKVHYVTGGSRTLLHPSLVQDFLCRMGYRRCYGKLGFLLGDELRLTFTLGAGQLAGLLAKVPGRIGALGRELTAVKRAIDIGRHCRQLPCEGAGLQDV